jgi:hypothetical protein
MGTQAFPTGTTTIFYQATAPVGWTQVVTYHDCSLRIISGGSGGTLSGSGDFSSVFVDKPVSATVTVGLAANSGNNSGSAAGSHTHVISGYSYGANPYSPYPVHTAWVYSGVTPTAFKYESTFSQQVLSSSGSGTVHTHPISYPTSTPSTTSPVNFAVQYLDHIVCSMN